MGPLLKFHLFDLVSVNGRCGGGGERVGMRLFCTLEMNFKNDLLLKRRQLRFLFGFDYFVVPTQFNLQQQQCKGVTVNLCTNAAVTGGH